MKNQRNFSFFLSSTAPLFTRPYVMLCKVFTYIEQPRDYFWGQSYQELERKEENG